MNVFSKPPSYGHLLLTAIITFSSPVTTSVPSANWGQCMGRNTFGYSGHEKKNTAFLIFQLLHAE